MDAKSRIDKDTVVCLSIAVQPGNFGARFHNSAYRILGLNWVYLPRKVETTSELEAAIQGVRSLGIRGCSVSMPHKEAVIQYLDALDSSAAKIGAVNTIKQSEDGKLTGYNSDYFGAKKALAAVDIEGCDVLMIGAGGVARAIGLAVMDLGGRLTMANRTHNKAQRLGQQLNAEVVRLQQIPDISRYLLINATSVGMQDPDSMIVGGEVIRNFEIVKDVVIYPAQTRFLLEAHKLGKQIIPGTVMCVYQAAEQFKIYTGLEAPSELISQTLETLGR